MTSDLKALADADFGWVQSLESVWSDEGLTEAGPNAETVTALLGELGSLTRAASPPARAFLGQAGIGKTHLVGVLRRRAWGQGCWFVLLDVIGITDFWKSAALSFVSSLMQPMGGGLSQGEVMLTTLAQRLAIGASAGADPLSTPGFGNALTSALMKHDFTKACRHLHVVRALLLLRSHDMEARGVGYGWLQGYDVDEEKRKPLGLTAPPPAAVEIVSGIMWLMALAGPLVVAVDQIDGVLIASAPAAAEAAESPTFAAIFAAGLLDLATLLPRGMIVLTALVSSWEIIKATGPDSLLHRFAAPVPLRPMQSEAAVRALIAARLAPAYAKAGLPLPEPAGPFTAAAIAGAAAAGMTPRLVLMRCDAHRRACIAAGEVLVCDSLTGEESTGGTSPEKDANAFDVAFREASAAADPTGLFEGNDDTALGQLLRDAFDLYARQIPTHDTYDVISKADPAQKTPPLHGRLTFTDHRDNDRERYFCFRALQHSNAVAFCSRLRAALTASGIGASIPHRRLIVVRRGVVPSGPRSRETFEAFRKAGGLALDPRDEDLRVFLALRAVRDAALDASRYEAFEQWLRDRQPLCDTAFFKAAGLVPPPLPDAGGPPPKPPEAPGQDPGAGEDLPPVPPEPPAAVAPPPAPVWPTTIPIGRRLVGGEAVELETALLPRHTAIIAGAGSGKTVLLRRIVEEAALAGIPSIVIDPNNDLSRLGDGWPERPAGFADEDAAKAARYASAVEVMVWTPGIHAGNPLFLPVLPDFAAIGDDQDEREQAVTMAGDTLGPLAGARNNLARGVLSGALRQFAERGGGSLRDFTAFLADLPEEVSEISTAERIAARLADELRAAVATNPLLKSGGPVIDPKLLFFGPDPARTRISVVNLSGLASNDAKEDFVNRLQMTLFGWIKRNPSRHGMLYVVDEAQVFIPSGTSALSKTSGVQLVAQARKYGLGMIVATQAPKGIDNKVVSNCTTQFLGKQNAPSTIEAARELIAAAGGRADDFGRLSTGQFYFKTEKSGKPAKVSTPICLSYHPPNPPTPEEVVDRAKLSRQRAE